MRGFWQRVLFVTVVMVAAAGTVAHAQPPVARPQPPPPVPGAKTPAAQPKPAPPAQTPGATHAVQTATLPDPASPDTAPPESVLNVPVFPSAQFLTSFNADLGQRFYLYGSTMPFEKLVAYYRTMLKDKGELVFDAPATHMFEVGKFKESDVAFPPGVTITDYSWQGSPGYLNPKPGGLPAYFPTVIQIVPPPPALAGRSR